MPRFPSPEQANEDGLLAFGGDLEPTTLLVAYRQGIFPWYMPGQPLLWWSPDPRMVLFTDSLKVSRSLAKTLKRHDYTLSFDTDFEAVVRACRDVRGAPESWIDEAMITAYGRLHALGHAHSVEVRRREELVGGLYGVAIGRVFFGESMFHHERDTSKIALVTLVRHLQGWGYPLIDCQVASSHLESLGAVEIPRAEFLSRITELVTEPGHPSPWHYDPERGSESRR